MAASFISNQTRDVAYWHLTSIRCDAPFWSLTEQSGQIQMSALTGSVANDPKRTYQSPWQMSASGRTKDKNAGDLRVGAPWTVRSTNPRKTQAARGRLLRGSSHRQCPLGIAFAATTSRQRLSGLVPSFPETCLRRLAHLGAEPQIVVMYNKLLRLKHWIYSR